MLNPGDTVEIARERLRVEAIEPRVKLRSLACPGVTRYPTLAFVEERGVVVERAPVVETEEPKRFYVFTRAELAEMLDSHIDMFLEYRDRHGRDEDAAKPCALSEMLEGLDAEHELWRLGECRTTHVQDAGGPVR